jgi:hypothetical protein
MEQSVKTLEKSIKATITEARKRGTTGMSFECLKQNTPTTGLTCSVPVYHKAFRVAASNVAKSFVTRS